MCERTYIEYACECIGRHVDRNKCEWMKQADKLVEGGMPSYHKSIIKLEKICESCYTHVGYNVLDRKCSKHEQADRDAAKKKAHKQKK
jgi:hypothetical protein